MRVIMEEAVFSARRTDQLRLQSFFPSPQLVPYGYQIVLLTEAMRINSQPTDEIIESLRRWLWRTAYTGYFSGARDSDVRKALEVVRGLARGSELTAQEEIVDTLPNRFDYRAARSKLIVLRLAEQRPQNSVGIPLDTRTVLNAYNARAILQLIAGSKVADKSASGPVNRFIVSPDEGRAFRQNLLSAAANESFLKSHAISPAAAAALDREDYQGFLALRRQTLIELERAFVEPLGLRYASE